MTDVLFTMNTCSMAMVGVSLIMMRRSELATCKQQVHHQPAISYRTIWRGLPAAQHSMFAQLLSAEPSFQQTRQR